MGKRPLPAQNALKYIHLRPPNRVFPRVPRGYAVARLVIIRPAEAKSAKPPDWRKQTDQFQHSLKGTWTVRLLRLDPSLLQAHRDKAASSPLLKPTASTTAIKSLKNYEERKHEESTDKPLQQHTLPKEFGENVLHCFDQKEISKKGNKSQSKERMPAENRLDQSTEDGREIKPLIKYEKKHEECTEELLQQHTLPIEFGENVLQCSEQKETSKKTNKSQRKEIMPAENRVDQSTEDRSDSNSTNSSEQQNIKLEKSYTCSECGEVFRTLPKLLMHQRIHTGKKHLTCNECGKSFLFHSLLVMHQRIHPGVSKNVTQLGDTNAERDNPYACKECGKRFSDPSTLIKHHQIHTEQKKYTCRECGKIFSSPQKYKNHMRKHTEKPYTCSECGKRFFHPSNLQKHQQIHQEVKPYACNECGMSFSQYSSLMDHHQHRHTGIKPYKCNECGKGFNYSSRLQIHQRLHTGESKETCPMPTS